MHAKKAGALSCARMTARQAVYAINTKLLPKLLYTGQVAHYTRKRVDIWDARHREIVRRAADLPLAMPIDIFYLPEAKGGYGLRSVRDGLDIQRVNMTIEALNDTWISRQVQGNGEENGGKKIVAPTLLHKATDARVQ